MAKEELSKKATGPLAGIKILDMSSVLLGPYATQILGDLGADVIKIEEPGSGDLMRSAGDPPRTPGMGPIFMTVNRNKRSVALDMKQERAKRLLEKLIQWADVFIHNVRASGMERLGFDYDRARSLNPSIIYVHASGFGSDGPYAGRQAYDDMVQAASGATELLGLVDGDPAPRYLPTVIVDKTTGLHAVYATLAALFHRERTGEGQFVEVPMFESFVSFLMVEHLYGQTFDPPTGPPEAVGYTRILNPNRRPFQTRDGYVSVMPYTDQQWMLFFEIGGKPEMMKDPKFANFNQRTKNIKELYGHVREMMASRTTAEWLELFDEAKIAAMPVNTIDDLFEDKHLKETGFFERCEHHSEGAYFSMKHPVRFAKTPADIRRNPPRLGEHTEEVFRQFGLEELLQE